MKKWMVLFFLVFVCAMYFQNCKNSNVPNNKTSGNAGFFDKVLVVSLIRNGDVSGTIDTLDNVMVIRKRSASTDSSQVYNKQPIRFGVKDGDEFIFMKNGKERVHIKIDSVLQLTQIGVSMFLPTASDGETIEGTVMGRNNTAIRQLPVIVGQKTVVTDSTGRYQSIDAIDSSFTIQYFRSGVNVGKNGIITANTTNDGGKTVIDVAFDDDGMVGDRR